LFYNIFDLISHFLNKVFQSQFLFNFYHYFTTGGAGTANPSGAPKFTPGFWWGGGVRSLDFV